MENELPSEKVSIAFLEPDRLMQMFNLSSTDIALLSTNRTALFARIDKLAAETMTAFDVFEGMRALLGEVYTAESFSKKMRDFLRDYFEGACDAEHIQDRDRWGRLFHRFEIYPKDFMPFLAFVQEKMESEIRHVMGDGENALLTVKAFDRFFRLDTAVIVDAFRTAEAGRDKTDEKRLRHYVDSLEKKLFQMTESLEELTQKDPLTNLYNQRGFYDNLYREIGNGKRHKWPVSIVYFDLNKFGEFNEAQGRRAGDRLLNIMAAAMTDTYRETDILCRYGYDDFVVIMPNAIAKDAAKVCRRLIEKFRKRNVYGVAFCMGVAQTGPDEFCSPDDLLDKAVENMKEAQVSLKDPKEFLLKV